MLKHKRLVSIIATLAFCLSFLAPALIAPTPAVAGTTYTVAKSALVTPSNQPEELGAVVKVVVDDVTLASGSRVTVLLPTEWDFANNHVSVDTAPEAGHISIVGANTGNTEDGSMVSVAALGGTRVIPINPNNTFDFMMGAPGVSEHGANKYFYIYFNGIDLNNMSGDLIVTFAAPAGSVFSSGTVNIGKSSRTGATHTSIRTVKDITSEGGDLDIISISELRGRTFNRTGTITLKILTKGVTWDKAEIEDVTDRTVPGVSYGWSFADRAGVATQAIFGSAGYTLDPARKELTYTLNGLDAINNEPGRISFANLPILIDDETAKVGETIKIKISGADMTAATIDVARYVDYGVTVEEGTSVDIIAGKGDQEVGTFLIKESAPGSLIEGRTIKVTLPSGAKWHDATSGELEVMNNGDITITNPTDVSGSNDQTLVFEIQDASENDAAILEFNEYTVDVAPNFAGPLEVTISGSAGVEGKVKIAEVKPALTISVDEVKNINLGQPNQPLGEITLTEGIAEGLEVGQLVLLLDDTYRWAKEPTVKVTEGDIDIDADVDVDGEKLTINIDSTSTEASKIVISDAYVDAYRIAPEGPIYLSIAAYDEGNTAILDVDDITDGDVEDDWIELKAGKAQIATCVTPSATSGRTVSMWIGSKTMEVNGNYVYMKDAAPYIKAGRTYVPVRYLAEDALGASVTWDEATKTVTITKGDKTVVLVIGDKVAKVNGADVQMDVAPEITPEGRTMLPARWVAEGLGFNVDWIAAQKQVLIFG